MKKLWILLLLSCVTCCLSSCSKYTKLLKSNDYEAKYNAAIEAYEKKNYYKSTQLFENLATYYRGRDKAENVSFYYAKSLLGSKDYYMAGYQFKIFTKQFPYSERIEEAMYQSAYCKYLESPVYSLDQSLTKEALADFQQYANRFPQSDKLTDVNKYMDELRGKLIKKDYEIAVGYYRIELYEAATVSLRNLLKDYPDSPYREVTMLYLIKSGYKLAKHSIESKKIARFQQVVNDFEKFSKWFSTSKYLKEAQDVYNESQTELRKLSASKS